MVIRCLLIVLSMLSMTLSTQVFASVDEEDSAVKLSLTLQSLLISSNRENAISLLQAGSNNHAMLLQTGSLNEIELDQLGSNNNATITQVGNRNEVSLIQLGDNNFSDIRQMGNNNLFQLKQAGGTQMFIQQASDNAVLRITQQ